MSEHRTPRLSRSILATPGSNLRMIEKALASDADMVFIDLEDAVVPDAKVAARSNVVHAFTELDWGGKARMFRVNALDTPYFYRDLIDVIETAGQSIDLVLVPKVNDPRDVYVVETLLGQLEAHLGRDTPIGIEVQIETATGMANCTEIAMASRRIEAIVFGPGDYAASIQMPVAAIGATDDWDAVYPGHRFHAAMHHLLVAGRAAGVRVIDGPMANMKDSDGLTHASQVSRALGYDGKWCIHPAQIEIVNDIFSPTRAEIAWATRVMQALQGSAESGHGAVSLDGVMLDAASARMAHSTLAKARSAALIVEEVVP